jgi:hypothetical protein
VHDVSCGLNHTDMTEVNFVEYLETDGRATSATECGQYYLLTPKTGTTAVCNDTSIPPCQYVRSSNAALSSRFKKLWTDGMFGFGTCGLCLLLKLKCARALVCVFYRMPEILIRFTC